MRLNRNKSFFIRVFGIEEQAEWLHSEQINIFITAIIPAFITFMGALVPYLLSGLKNPSSAIAVLESPIFTSSLQLVLIIGTLLVLYRKRRSILVTRRKRPRLQQYLKCKYPIRDRSDENVELALDVTAKTVKQFYIAWIVLWCFFFAYYSGSLCFDILEHIFGNDGNNGLRMLRDGVNNLFNYLSSTAMFALFVILNSATSSRHERKAERSGIISAIFFISLFGCTIIFSTLFLFTLQKMDYFNMQLGISILLGVYSAFSFVLVLGKLNTNLQIPRVMFYGLYIYALMQMFEFLLMSGNDLDSLLCTCNRRVVEIYNGCCYPAIVIHEYYCKCSLIADYIHTLKVFRVVFEYIAFSGKLFLSLTLLWIVYDSKFIYFVIQQSQAISELPYMMTEFKTYMNDVT